MTDAPMAAWWPLIENARWFGDKDLTATLEVMTARPWPTPAGRLSSGVWRWWFAGRAPRDGGGFPVGRAAVRSRRDVEVDVEPGAPDAEAPRPGAATGAPTPWTPAGAPH